MQRDTHGDDENDDGFDREGSRPDCSSYKPNDPVGSVDLPIEERLRSRIENFLVGYGLTRMGKAIALRWIQSIGADTTGDFARVRGWLLGRLNAFGTSRRRAAQCSSRAGISHWQKGCPEIIPGLRPRAFWSADDFDAPWVTKFVDGFKDVREELLALRGRGGFQPYRAPRDRSRCEDAVAAEDGVGSHCHEGGDWNVFYLFLHDAVDFSENRSMCSKTVSLVESLPRHYKHAFFSALAPGTHVVKHNGPTNKKLRIHLPILAPGGGLSRLRVGSETREVVAGRALIFDDSFEHEAWNDDDAEDDNGNGNDQPPSPQEVSTEARKENEPGRHRRPTRVIEQEMRESTLDEEQGRAVETRGGRGRKSATRVTLIADVWHPDLSNREVRFLSFLQEATLRLEKRMVEGAERKSSNLFQDGVRRGTGIDDTHRSNAPNVVGDDSGDLLRLPAPPATAVTSPTTARRGEIDTRIPTSPRRNYCDDGEARAAAGGARAARRAAATVATKIHASAAEGRRANTPTGDSSGCGNRCSDLVSERRGECLSEETKLSTGTGGSRDAGGTAIVAVDNFLNVINRARALCSNEVNIFGP